MRLRRRIHHVINCRWRIRWRRFGGAPVRIHLCTCGLMDGLERAGDVMAQLGRVLAEAERQFPSRRHLVVCLSTLQLEDIRTSHPTAVLIDRCIISGVPGLDGAMLRLARGVGGVGGL